jgi:hypothetical protein
MRVTLFYLIALAAQRTLTPFGIELTWRAYLAALFDKSGDRSRSAIAWDHG